MRGIRNYLLIILIAFTACQNNFIKKTKQGIIVYPDKLEENQPALVMLQPVSDNIIRVMSVADKDLPESKSLMILEDEINNNDVEWTWQKNNNEVILYTKNIKTRVKISTGEIQFSTPDDEVKLKELNGGSKSFKQVEHEDGHSTYEIRQIFESPDDEAFYGLGQHQNGYLNYKGKNVNLLQHNIVAVVPFIISSKNYGILWDNYSCTKFGDPRNYQNISNLKLYSKDGTEGGLTATYKSKENPSDIYLEQIENKIEYQYLKDVINFHGDFGIRESMVEWNGFLESDYSGEHWFNLYCSGYTKLWIDGKKIIDIWRQPWNPWNNEFVLDIVKGKKYKIKLEWDPDGESFIAFKWLSPVPSEKQNRLSLFSESGNAIDYYFINGNNIDEIISGYRKITGKAPVMPKWALGLWQSRERYRTQEELTGVVKEFRKRRIPLDNIVLDWFYWHEDKWGDHKFDPGRFPDPVGMINALHKDYNTHIMISVWPKFYVGTENYKKFNDKGWLYTSNVKNQQKDWIGYVSTFYDAFNPEARKLFWKGINEELFSKGFDAWWLDATEPDILSNTCKEKRKKLMKPLALGSSSTYFNAYSLLHSKGVYEGQRQVKPNQRVFILTRSAYAGQQRYAAATWSGDLAATWHDLKNQIPAGLNFSMSGIPYWTSDIGGFSVENRYIDARGEDLDEWQELMARWFEFGAFCPIFRVHGQYPYREMFNVAPDDHIAYKAMLKYDILRYKLMPYIYSMAGWVYYNDYTIMRALIMDFPEDILVRNIGDQFMFGPALMVAPVYEYKARSRKVYLPDNSGWYNLNSGKYYNGGMTVHADAPLDIIPVFVREGSIIPIGPDIQYTTEKPADTIKLCVYAGKDGEFDLYEDENINYNYEKGDFSVIPIIYNDDLHTITFGKYHNKFGGMLEKRVFEVYIIYKDNPKGIENLEEPDKTIIYNGNKQIVKI